MTTAQTTTVGAPLKRVWLVWGIAAVLLALYYALASVASTGVRAELVLSPGCSVHLPVTSVSGHAVAFELDFSRRAEDLRKADLGSWDAATDVPGGLRFANPGKRVAGTVSVNGGAPVLLAAMPASGYGAGFILRSFSENLPVAPGEWHWPPAPLKAYATAGRNDVVVTITDVDPALTGETVELWALPPVSFKVGTPDYAWLWWAYLLVPLGALLLACVALVLLYRTWRARRNAPQAPRG